MIKLHSLETTIIKDKKEVLKLNGQVHGLNEYEIPKVVIYDKKGDPGFVCDFGICESMSLLDFAKRISFFQRSAYSLKGHNPLEYSIIIKMEEIKEAELK